MGKYLTDTVGYSLGGSVPALENMPRHNCDGIGGMHVYVPWWELDKKNKDFPRGYHIEIGGGLGMPQLGSFRGAAANAGYGPAIKAAARQQYGTNVSFAGRGEMIPNEALLVRNRQREGRSVGHPGTAIPLGLAASTKSRW